MGQVNYNLNMPRHRNTDNNRGWANIEFDDAESAQKFISEVNGKQYGERELNVSQLKERESSSSNETNRPMRKPRRSQNYVLKLLKTIMQ